jgi:DNA/RNA-binding domain of Phe-tRNA-synthetase-like protein
MYFTHAPEIWRDFPELVPGMLYAEGITNSANVDEPVTRYSAIARERLSGGTESDLPEIQAWRRAFSRMGLKPTQYRCASEALLRRFRIDGELPRIHPLIDLYNAISIAFAIPIGVLDVTKVAGGITVCHATGDEQYETFSGEMETPYPGEVIFSDEAGYAHARRWTNRQSGRSAVRDDTSAVFFVTEAVHPTASEDVPKVLSAITTELKNVWGIESHSDILTPANVRFETN